MRIGIGIDVHPFEEGRRLVIGGVHIPGSRGLEGHSDADVLLHAVSDALLGAAALGDIGLHFPNTSMEFKDIDSMILLRHVGKLLEKNGYTTVNVDAMLLLEAPKIAAYVTDMRKNIARALGLEIGAVSVKATTNEKLGYIGREEGAAAHAVCIIKQL